MNESNIDPQEDKRHTPDSDELLWGESWYFNVYDPVQDVALFTRMGLYANKGVANMAVLMTVGGVEAYNRAWHNLPLPEGDMDIDTDTGLSLGGVSYRALELLKKFLISFHDELIPLKVDLEWEGIMPAYNAMAGHSENQATRFHLEQAGKVTGTISFRDEQWSINGVGNRDHSIGVRNWNAFTGHNLAWPVFEDGTALGILQIHFEGGESADLSWSFDGNEVKPMKLERYEATFNDEHKPVSAIVAAVDAGGTRYEMTCTRKGLIHWPFDGYLLNEAAFEFRLADGRLGYGLLEMGVRAGTQKS